MRTKTKNSLQKNLSVIYFIDAKKTRSFNLALSRVKFLILLVCLVAGWAGFSIFWVGRSFEKTDLLKDRLHASLNTIFEYQTRYDGVYELAYPRIIQQIKERQNHLSSAVAEKNAMGPQSESSGRGGGSDHALSLEKYQSKGVIDLESDRFRQSSDPQWPVIVEEISFNKDQGDFELNFAIRNIQSPTRAEGYIWSVITVINKNGERSYIGSPSGLEVNKSGEVVKPPKGANWYSIRYYKAKSFYFQIPDGLNSAVESIAIGMVDADGKKSDYTFPIEKEKVIKASSSSKRLSDEIR